jgi:hypothetical protein
VGPVPLPRGIARHNVEHAVNVIPARLAPACDAPGSRGRAIAPGPCHGCRALDDPWQDVVGFSAWALAAIHFRWSRSPGGESPGVCSAEAELSRCMWRRGQVVKARVCKTLITGSNPVVASEPKSSLTHPAFTTKAGSFCAAGRANPACHGSTSGALMPGTRAGATRSCTAPPASPLIRPCGHGRRSSTA